MRRKEIYNNPVPNIRQWAFQKQAKFCNTAKQTSKWTKFQQIADDKLQNNEKPNDLGIFSSFLTTGVEKYMNTCLGIMWHFVKKKRDEFFLLSVWHSKWLQVLFCCNYPPVS